MTAADPKVEVKQKTAKCECCGKVFKQKNLANKFCSDRCRNRAFNYRKVKFCGKCGKEFHSYTADTKYCTECQKVFFIRVEVAPRLEGKYTKICEHCEQTYRTDRVDARFCSRRCSRKYHHTHDNHAKDTVIVGAIPEAEYECRYCGKSFYVFDSILDKRTSFCSGICEKRQWQGKLERNNANRGMSGAMSLSMLEYRERRNLD